MYFFTLEEKCIAYKEFRVGRVEYKKEKQSKGIAYSE